MKKRFLPLVLFLLLQAACAQGIRMGREDTGDASALKKPVMTFTPAGGVMSNSKYTLFVRTGSNFFHSGENHGKKVSFEDPLMKAGETQVLNKVKNQKQ